MLCVTCFVLSTYSGHTWLSPMMKHKLFKQLHINKYLLIGCTSVDMLSVQIWS